MRADPIDYRDLVREFEWTRPRHGGDVESAALVFGVNSTVLEMRLRRACKAGFPVTYTHCTTGERTA